MSGLYFSVIPVRAEQYQVGMGAILGRAILAVAGQTTFAPHTVRCVLTPGDWVVENGDRLINFSGHVVKQGETVVVLPDAEFCRRYRQIEAP